MALTGNKKVWKIMVVIFLLITLVFAILFYFSRIFITFVVGLVLILITEKLIENHRKSVRTYMFPRWKRKLYSSAMILFWVFAIFFLLGRSVEDLSGTLIDIGNQNQTISGAYVLSVEPYVPEILAERLLTPETIKTAEGYIFSFFSDFFSKLSFFIFNGVLIIPLMFYMYFGRKQTMIEGMERNVPSKFQNGFRRAWDKIYLQLHDYFEAKAIESIVIGVICCLGFFVAGVKGWLVLGLLAGFLNIMPYIGPIIGAIPPLLIALFVDPIMAWYVLITVVVAQLVDNFYLIPFMISSKVRVDALVTIVLILVGAQLLGVLGMIFAIPIYLVYKTVLQSAYEELIKIYKK